MEAQGQETTGIREVLEDNPVVGERRQGVKRFWTGREEKLLRQHYPQGGVPACLEVLPGRSASAIYNRAGQLGLRRPGADGRVVPRQRWHASPPIDAVIRRTYQSVPSKGDIAACAKAVGRPRWWVSKRARELGLVVPRFKAPAWTDAETELVRELAHKQPASIQRSLKHRGYHRSETAILVKLKRLGADRTDPNAMNANQLAECLGVDRKTVGRWIEQGWLKATRRQHSDRDDYWRIKRKDVRRFIIENTAQVDLRKVDRFWFVDLLTEREGGV